MLVHACFRCVEKRCILANAGMLSPGELQRLCFARLLFHCPTVALMDEPVSAVGSKTGFALLRMFRQAGIAAVVTGQSDGPLANDSQAEQLFYNTVVLDDPIYQ